MILDILFSTLNSGINNIPTILLAPREDVRYIVSHQVSDQQFRSIPSELLNREDVLVSQIEGTGLNRSRNNAIKHSSGDICLFADDDVVYCNEYFDSILSAYQDNPDFDFIFFKAKGPFSKIYPDTTKEIFNLEYPIMSIEVSFKRLSIVHSGLYCDERFGVGNKVTNGGSEVAFLRDAFNASKFRFLFFSSYIVEHPQETTIKALARFDRKRIRVPAATSAKNRGCFAFLSTALNGLKLRRMLSSERIPFSYYISNSWKAIFYILLSSRYRFSIIDFDRKYPRLIKYLIK